MSCCLITGMGGFLGSHLADFALAQGARVVGIVREDTRSISHLQNGVTIRHCDILDKAQVETAVREATPAVIFHLAAQSLPSVSWQEPQGTFRVNVFGTLNLLEAVRKTSFDPVVIIAGSSAEYGPSAALTIINEEDALRPPSPYGVSKAASSFLAFLYCRAFQMKVIVARPFFVIGPRKSGDVCSDFARSIVAIERGQQPCLTVDNLETVRDFLDVDDAVQAFWLLAQKGTPGGVYNICSGMGHQIGTVLDILLKMATVTVPVEPKPSRQRPVDELVVVGDNSRLRALEWEPRVSLEESLANILDYWRRQP